MSVPSFRSPQLIVFFSLYCSTFVSASNKSSFASYRFALKLTCWNQKQVLPGCRSLKRCRVKLCRTAVTLAKSGKRQFLPTEPSSLSFSAHCPLLAQDALHNATLSFPLCVSDTLPFFVLSKGWHMGIPPRALCSSSLENVTFFLPFFLIPIPALATITTLRASLTFPFSLSHPAPSQLQLRASPCLSRALCVCEAAWLQYLTDLRNVVVPEVVPQFGGGTA